MPKNKPDPGERRIRVRSIRRPQPDLRRLAAALIELARAQSEADAEAQHRRHAKPEPPQEPRP